MSPARAAAILAGVAMLCVATIIALVCYKTGLRPSDFPWIENGWLSAPLEKVLRASRHELVALALAALNLAWLLVCLQAVQERPVSGPGGHVPDAAPGASDATLPGDREDEGNAHADASAAMAVRATANADAQLAIAAAELTRLRGELSICRGQLDVANATRSQFLANMSHELRTPMNGIIGMTDLLLGGELAPRERRFAQSIAVSSNALLGSIGDLLDFSRIESGTLHLERSRFRIRDAVEDVCAMLAGRAHEKGIELMCYVDDNVPPLVDGDASRLRQVLDNLIRNAIAFTGEGEVVVRVSCLEDRGTRSLYRCDVQDTGSGISPEMQMSMFDAFTQADSSTTRRHGGLGMGLAIVRELVRLMSGTITFRSRLGEGTRFGFTVELGNVDADVEDGLQRCPIRGARVLVVDDNETNRTILYHQLCGWGVVADTVESGARALERLHETTTRGEPYDLLVLDLHMPGMDGLELARRIRDEPAFASIRSLMLTSAVLELDDEELAALGIDRYVSKPARQSVLHESLVSLLASGNPGVRAPERRAMSMAPVAAYVLLAEDDVVGQDVGVGLLESVGCRVDVASDGREALERARITAYDLILMDCRMPGLDGYGATEAIRTGGGPNARTPIVALTASAMRGDRERCLAAGMDDYLAKPVRRDDLRALLGQWLASTAADGTAAHGRTADATASERAPAVTDETPSEVAGPTVGEDAKGTDTVTEPSADEGDAEPLPERLDLSAVQAIRALQRPGKPDLLGKVLDVYLNRTPPIIAAMRLARDAADVGALGEQVHALKSSSAYLGAARLVALCDRLERAAERGDAAAAAPFVTLIEEEFAALSAELGTLRSAA